MSARPCPFCPTYDGEQVRGRRKPLPRWPHVASKVTRWAAEHVGGVYGVFEPLNPVTPGHLLVVPETHVEHAAADPTVAAGCMEVAATIAARHGSANVITSIGAPATQTVRHLHLHVVPRAAGDGLHLPWTGQAPLAVTPNG